MNKLVDKSEIANALASPNKAHVREQIISTLTQDWMKRRIGPPLAVASPTQRRRAGVYLRYSTEAQDPHSLERQLKMAREYATSTNADIVAVFQDPAASGAFTANRPGFRALIAAARRHEFDICIIEEGDRLSRKLSITTAAFDVLASCGVEIHSGKSGKWTLMHAAIMGLLSEEQRTRLRDLMKSGIVKILGRNLWPGRTPIGYERVFGQPGELIIHPEDAATVKRVFQMRANGYNKREIARVLQSEGLKRKKGGPWTKCNIRLLLMNPIYMGLIIYFRTAATKVQIDDTTITRTVTPRPEADWIYGYRPDWAIVDVETWQKVQGLDKKRKGEPGPPNKRLLTRLVYCGNCGERMSANGSSEARPRYSLKCTRNIRNGIKGNKKAPRCDEPGIIANVVEAHVIRMVCEKLNTPGYLQQMQTAYESTIEEQANAYNHDRVRLQNERTEITRRLDATMDAAMVAGLTTTAISEQRKNYCARLEEIDLRIAEIPRLVLSKTEMFTCPVDAEAFITELTPDRTYKDPSGPLAQLMNSFRQLIDKVIVKTDRAKNEVRVDVTGLIASTKENGALTVHFEREKLRGFRARSARNRLRNGAFALTDSDWEKIAKDIPTSPIWIEGFATPVQIRKVLEAILFLKNARVGFPQLDDHFGDRKQIWAAARILSYGGILELVQGVMAKYDVAVARGLHLSLDALRCPRKDILIRHAEWNDRRMQQVLHSTKSASPQNLDNS